MKRAIEEALAQCLSRLEQGASIDECLRGHEGFADELRPYLEAAQALRRERTVMPDYRQQAFERGRARMRAARADRAEGRGGLLGGLIPWRPVGLVAVMAAAALLALLGLTTDLFRFDTGTTSAQVQGVVSSADQDSVVLTTDDGQVIIRIGENTIVLDASGKAITSVEIVPGKSARAEIKREDGSFSGVRIEVEDDDDARFRDAEVEFTGVIKAVQGAVLTLQTSFGEATVRMDGRTEVKGALAAGATVRVHATLQGDGAYLAREVDVRAPAVGDDDDDDDDDDRDDRRGPGRSGDDRPSRGPGSGSDDDDDGPRTPGLPFGSDDDDDDDD